jgi:hypothetical protein
VLHPNPFEGAEIVFHHCRPHESVMLRRLFWSSVPSPSFSAARINQIVSAARRNNSKHEISGMLLFTGVHFLEVLEGEDRNLADLWGRLQQDQRHRELFLISDDRCERRMYPEWKMGYLVDHKVDVQIESLHRVQAQVGRGPCVGGCSEWAANIIHPIMLRADSM